jgi:hypothetical protein
MCGAAEMAYDDRVIWGGGIFFLYAATLDASHLPHCRHPGITFVDRAGVTLKGLSSPIRVIQIAPKGVMP